MTVEKSQAEKTPQFIKEIDPIEIDRGRIEITHAILEGFVEAPLLSACQELYDKNILTIASSANQKDIAEGYAYIFIDYDHLSPENRKIADEFGQPTDFDGRQAIKIEIPINENSTVVGIRESADVIAHRFQHQNPTWI